MHLPATGLFKYVWPFCYHQSLKGQYVIECLFNVNELAEPLAFAFSATIVFISRQFILTFCECFRKKFY